MSTENTTTWRALVESGFPGPAFHRDDLRRVGNALSSDTVTGALRGGKLPFRARPDWSRGLPAMRRVFGLDVPHHLFRAEPIHWCTFREDQLTRGLAHFLGAGGRATRIERIRALLKALRVETPLDPDGEKVTTSARAEQRTLYWGRIDVLIEWKDPSNRIVVAIEAKLHHPALNGQLASYQRYVRETYPAHEQVFLVVSSDFTEEVRAALRSNQQWRWRAWSNVLLAHERALPGDCDDHAYRQFRRTLWEQTC